MTGSKKFCAVLIALLVPTAAARVAAVEPLPAPPRIMVNEQEIPLDVRPRVVAETVLVPLRFIGEALGADVAWEPRLKVATIQGPRTTVTARIGDATVRAGSGTGGLPVRAYTSEAAPRIINGRTMLPLRTVGLALGAKVAWDERTKTVRIQR